jgi:hypothetical protein
MPIINIACRVLQGTECTDLCEFPPAKLSRSEGERATPTIFVIQAPIFRQSTTGLPYSAQRFSRGFTLTKVSGNAKIPAREST